MSSLPLSLFRRVTYQLMRKGETASYRGRDKNILASSSNTMTPATTNTIRTHTDRYMRTHIPWFYLLAVRLIISSGSDFWIPEFEGQTEKWTTNVSVSNYKNNSLSLMYSLSTNPGHKAASVYVCVSEKVYVLTGFSPADRIIGTSSVFFFPLYPSSFSLMYS